MHLRAAMGMGLLMCSAACGSSRGSTATIDTTDTTDGGSPVEPGTVGAHVWFDSSTGIELAEVWFFDTFGPDAGPPRSGSLCWALERSALDAAQLEALENVILVPLTDACTADGFRYHELTVVGSDGAKSAYRDTGCSYLRLDGAMAMLPSDFFSPSVFPATNATACAR